MARKFSDAVVNAMGNAYETTIGASPTLEFRTGAPPATCATADSGTLLATLTLPADFMGASSGRVVAKAGTWTGVGAAAAGAGTAIGHFRVKQGATCHDQGTVTVTGGGGDMLLDNVSIANGQAITISTFTLTGPAA